MTPLPRPAHVDLADFTDGYIRALAYAVDAAIGSAFMIATLPVPTTVTTDANGQAMLTFPGLNQVAGALVAPAGITKAAGPRGSYPPVPPATYGWSMTIGPVFTLVQSLGGGGQVLIRVMTMSSNRGDYNGVTQQWGTQIVVPNTSVPVSGLAWGPPS
jgi:hypothetical protein